MTPIVIVGAGGLGREVHDVIEAMVAAGRGDLEVVGFVDDGQPDKMLIADRGVPHLGGMTALAELPSNVQYVLAIGSSAVRRRLDAWATAVGRSPCTVVHPAAVIGSHRVTLGAGTVVCAGACITTNIDVGRHVVIDRHVDVGHDSVIGDYVTLHPGSTLSGGVIIEEGATVGSNACVIPGKRVGARAVVGAGAVVIRDVVNDETVVGVPAEARVK